MTANHTNRSIEFFDTRFRRKAAAGDTAMSAWIRTSTLTCPHCGHASAAAAAEVRLSFA